MKGLILTSALRVLLLFEALGFLLFAVLHLGLPLSLGFVLLEEPPRPYAVMVESAAAFLLTLGALAAITHRPWAWATATVAHVFALVGVLWGIVAIQAGRGPHTPLNDTFHGVMIVLLIAGLIFSMSAGRVVGGRD
jgi:hypothetical protein